MSNYGLHDELLSLYFKCQILGCSSDNYTFPFVIKACASIRDLRTGKEIHCVVLRKRYEDNLVVQTALIDMYAKNGCMKSSRFVFDVIPQPDLVSWNALLSGYSFNGLDHEAFQVVQQVQVKGFKPNVSTFASLIPVCTRLGTSEIGRSIHGLTLRCGFSMDDKLVPALISMYSSNGDLTAARKLFDLLDTKTVVVWNSMISAYSQNHMSNEAFELYCKMVGKDVHHDLVTFVSIVPSCGNLDSNQYGESVHARGIKHGLAHQSAVVTALLSMYAKLGYMDSADFLFDGMLERDLYSWNSMVSGYVQNGLLYKGLTAFHQMLVMGPLPDSVTLLGVLSACTRLNDTLMGMSAHAYCLRNGFDLTINVSNALLAFYSECYKLSTSISLFRRMVTRNVISWNTLISSCVHHCDMRNAITFIQQMQQENVKFDLVTVMSILPCYCDSEELIHGMSVHGYSLRTGFISDVSVINALISMYINCEDLDAGNLLFAGMHVRTVVSWNALITGYRYSDLHKEAMTLFRHMTMGDQKPNFVTLLNVLPICHHQLHGKSIHAYAVRTGDVLEPHLLTSLICMYSRFENVSSSCLLFESADKRNVTVWNAIMSVHVESGNANLAVTSFTKMLQMQQKPDYVTILTLISACCQLTSLALSESVMAFIVHKGFENELSINNSLMDVYARCGYLTNARKMFDDLKIKDIVSWSVIINGYGIHGNAEAALTLFSQMRCSGLKPDDVTYISILSACSHAGLVEQARMLFNSMVEDFGITPRMEHYACMVDLLGRTGRLNEAYHLVKGLPFRPSLSLLESLLGACSIHGDLELAEEISRLFFDMNPKSVGPYVMLSNVYAAAGRWGDASRVRSKMEEIQVKKVPGISLVELDSH
ncbi:Pentatricopeptide repeat-containing protein [Thalictrum thalictroides]|uniref:Pentatricopeptide repeat-containing protein n=1 Tax=Thalictrum thalictroides TaxID=46969 RepID=A0A7J6X7K1_THATH|nr:Pentatricopeptide repeat-containing protein [Thalictrum thalictroides]